MCGIAGVWHLDGRGVSAEMLGRMADVLRHRGPDDRGFVVIDPTSAATPIPANDAAQLGFQSQRGYSLGFAHQRLSILDLSNAGHQPMSNDDGSVWLVYNGEIYNYIELREELSAAGFRFRSGTDTEVILRAYEAWGPECVKRFNGMWAFVLWDAREKRLVASRDRLGVKPLYTAWLCGSFLFASEIKGILASGLIEARANDRTVATYLRHGFGYLDTTDETFFEGIEQLPPATLLIIKNGQAKIERYWDLPQHEETDEGLASRFGELLQDSVRLRLRSDVQVGGALSGGLDSSSITALAARLLGGRYETFSVCYDDPRYDEREWIRPVAAQAGVANHEVFPRAEQLPQSIERLLWHQDEPFPDLNIYGQWCMYGAVRDRGVKVFLNGHGGDELLGGYADHQLAFLTGLALSARPGRFMSELQAYARLRNIPWRSAFGQVVRRFAATVIPRSVRRAGRPAANDYLDPCFAPLHPSSPVADAPHRFKSALRQARWESVSIAPLPAWLHLEDRNSMAFSVESRTPFLDYRLVELAFTAPDHAHMRNGYSKSVLRESMRGLLPETVRLRADKKGFQSAGEAWFRSDLRTMVGDVLTSASFRGRGYLDQVRVMETFEAHNKGSMNARFSIWSWVCLELWFRTMIDRPVLETAGAAHA